MARRPAFALAAPGVVRAQFSNAPSKPNDETFVAAPVSIDVNARQRPVSFLSNPREQVANVGASGRWNGAAGWCLPRLPWAWRAVRYPGSIARAISAFTQRQGKLVPPGRIVYKDRGLRALPTSIRADDWGRTAGRSPHRARLFDAEHSRSYGSAGLCSRSNSSTRCCRFEFLERVLPAPRARLWRCRRR